MNIQKICGIFMGIAMMSVPFSVYAQTYVPPKVTSYDVVIDLDRQGTVVVNERIVFEPGSKPQAPITRVIPTMIEEKQHRLDVSVAKLVNEKGESVKYLTTEEAAGLKVVFGNADELVTSTQKFVFTYVVNDAVVIDAEGKNYAGFQVLDDAFVYPVTEVRALINLPREVPQRDLQFWCSKVSAGGKSACTKRLFRSVDGGNLVDALLGSVDQMPEKSYMMLEVSLPAQLIKHKTQTATVIGVMQEYWMYELAGLLVIVLLIVALRSRKTPPVEPET